MSRYCVNRSIICVINPTTHIMKSIISKHSVTNEQKLTDLLSNTVPNGECMEWTRCYNTDGYPHMFGNVKVHRWVNKLFTGKDNTGYVVRHTCDNIRCINPEHLITGTNLDNIQDRDERGRTYKVITKEVVFKVKTLLNTKILSHREIADIVGIDIRRVSDINCNKYNDDAKLVRR